MSRQTLNDLMEIDHVILVTPHLAIDDHPENAPHAPESIVETDDDGQILGEHEKTWIESITRQGWELLTGYSGQSGYAGPIMHSSEYIGGHLEEHITDHPGFYVAVTVETLDDSEHAAGWAVAFQPTEITSESYRCPCCGDDVIAKPPVCADCELAECKRSNSVEGRNYSNCQRTDDDSIAEYHLQFCDREANQDITSSHTAERDATEVRLWSADSTCIVAAEKNSRSGMWHVSASDVYNWTAKARKAWPSWQEAMCSLGDEIRDAMGKADR